MYEERTLNERTLASAGEGERERGARTQVLENSASAVGLAYALFPLLLTFWKAENVVEKDFDLTLEVTHSLVPCLASILLCFSFFRLKAAATSWLAGLLACWLAPLVRWHRVAKWAMSGSASDISVITKSGSASDILIKSESASGSAKFRERLIHCRSRTKLEAKCKIQQEQQQQ